MITIKYTKTFPANLLSHVDTLRALQRTFRRAGINLDYSQGFNPHMLLFMSPPLTLGTASFCEYVTAQTPAADISGIADLFNRYAPAGIRASEAFYTEKNPRLAAKITAAEYILTADGLGAGLKGFSLPSVYEITYSERGEQKTKDVGDMIYSVWAQDNNNVLVRLACGNKNLKADRLLRFWCGELGLDYARAQIQKTGMFAGDIEIDGYLAALDLANE